MVAVSRYIARSSCYYKLFHPVKLFSCPSKIRCFHQKYGSGDSFHRRKDSSALAILLPFGGLYYSLHALFFCVIIVQCEMLEKHDSIMLSNILQKFCTSHTNKHETDQRRERSFILN